MYYNQDISQVLKAFSSASSGLSPQQIEESRDIAGIKTDDITADKLGSGNFLCFSAANNLCNRRREIFQTCQGFFGFDGLHSAKNGIENEHHQNYDGTFLSSKVIL